MKANDLIAEIKRRLGLDTNRALARALGMSEMALNNWQRLKKPLSVRRVANAIYKARQSAIRETQLRTIRPIVELFPLDTVESASGLKFELFPTRKDGTKLTQGLRDLLSKAHGIYVFYDSRGRALYVGKARQQSLWTELKFAFNRSRSTQKVFRVSHPKRSQAFKPGFAQSRQPKATQLNISEFAAFVSIYEIEEGMIDDLEALLVRGFANDLLNRKMERFKHARPSKKKSSPKKQKNK
jgi:hypothetical protein